MSKTMQLAHVHNVKSSKQKPRLKLYVDYITKSSAGTTDKNQRITLKVFK